jgi:hypothetical protein
METQWIFFALFSSSKIGKILRVKESVEKNQEWPNLKMKICKYYYFKSIFTVERNKQNPLANFYFWQTK